MNSATRPEQTQQPQDPAGAVEILHDSHEETQQPPGDRDVVEVVHGDPAVAEVAARQRGAVSYAELRAAGLGRGAIHHRFKQGRLHRQHRGVYLVGHEVPAEQAPLFAAALALGPDAYISNRTALEEFGVLNRRPGPIHVTVIGRCRRSRDGIRVHRTTRIAPEDVGLLDGALPITSPARALLDFADTANPRDLEWAVNEAHLLKLVTPQELYELIARTPGRRGTRKLKAILARYDGPRKAHPGGERLLLAGFRSARITGYEANAIVHGKEVDFFFADHGVVVEVDSARYHGTPTAANRDRRKDAFLRKKELLVLRYSYEQVDEELPFVLAEIASHLPARSRSEPPYPRSAG
jgi:very-short-patch-repair endonuclease